jgi:outer membrane protein OmpA-like peptidoglycan-associated protein
MTMKRLIIHASAVATIIVAAGNMSLSLASAADVKQMGSQPKYDDLIKSLTPDSSQVGPGNSRGLRVLSGKTTVATSSAGASASAPAQDARAPAVALDIRFAKGSDELTDAAHDTIDRIGAALKSGQLSTYRFRVEGHTDSTGNPDANLVLSQRRAEAVKSYLVSNEGIPADRLETVGKGSTEPLDTEHPANGINRRVQIVNLGQ